MGVFSKVKGKGLRLFGSSKKKQKGAVQKSSGKRRVIFVTHEATLTGAPKIILNIMKRFHATCDIDCECLMYSGGHLAEEFARHGVTDCFNMPRKSSEEVTKRIKRFVNQQKDNLPVLAVCNSMESRFITAELKALGIPTIALIHELPSSYSEEDYQHVYETSDKVIYPVHAVRDAADAKLPIPAGKSVVLSQGLLDPTFGTGVTRDEAYVKIRKELNLPENAFIVLGCGTLDLRKGIDHYAAVARQVTATNNSGIPIHFVWVGEGQRWTHSPYHYVNLDLEKSCARNYVHFIGERNNVEPYFMGADTFLMSSRVDPFPCVIHEAMAAGLPVITFANSGGAPEAIAGGAGFVAPYADYEQVASIIRMLNAQPGIATGIRERSKERVRTRYRFEDYADKIIDLGESMISQRLRHPVQAPAISPGTERRAA